MTWENCACEVVNMINMLNIYKRIPTIRGCAFTLLQNIIIHKIGYRIKFLI